MNEGLEERIKILSEINETLKSGPQDLAILQDALGALTVMLLREAEYEANEPFSV